VLRTRPFEFGVGATLLMAAAIFAGATLIAVGLGNDRIELSVGPVVLYRFVNVPGLSLLHVGPAVFLLAILAGVGQAVVARTR